MYPYKNKLARTRYLGNTNAKANMALNQLYIYIYTHTHIHIHVS